MLDNPCFGMTLEMTTEMYSVVFVIENIGLEINGTIHVTNYF